jgi:hypothetical protein
MPTTLMSGLQNFQHMEPETFAPSRVTPQTPTNTSMASLMQQMDESNHAMVNMLTTQIGTMSNPLIQNTNESYQMLAYQMGRIADFFGTPPPRPRVNQPVRQAIMADAPVAQLNQGQILLVRDEPQYHDEVEQAPQIVLVNRNQYADEVVRNV